MLQLNSRVNQILSTLKVGATIQNKGDLKMKKRHAPRLAFALALGCILGIQVSLGFHAFIVRVLGALLGAVLVWCVDDCAECDSDEDEDDEEDEDKQYSLSTHCINDDIPHPADENDSNTEDDEIGSI